MPEPDVTAVSTAHPRTTSGCPAAAPLAGTSIAIAGPARTLSSPVLVELCPSGLVMVMALRPPMALTVEMFTVTDVGLLMVTELMVTPGIVAPMTQAKPAGAARYAAFAAPGVPVTTRSTDGRFACTDVGVTLTGTGGAAPCTRATCRPYESTVSVNCCSDQIVV